MAVIYYRRAAAILAANVTLPTNVTIGNGTAPSLGVPDNVQQLWGQYAPWYSTDGYKAVPDGCEIVQVNLLQREGARYPEQDAADVIQGSLKKLKNVKTFSDSKFDFIKTYTYSLGLNDLVPFGAAQSFDAGQDHYTRYSNLVNDSMLPFVRASFSDHVVNSANNWTSGFAQASKNKYVPKLSVTMSQTGNNTLDNQMCPAAGDSKNQTNTWSDTFALTMASEMNDAAPGANLTGSDMINFMQLCGFDTVAQEKASPWCALFVGNQWSDFEYYADLDTYYGTGYGQKLGPVQGVGYVNELLARLTGQPVQDETQTNHTLDNSTETFPIDRTFYADFTHDDEMIAIYSALGLFNQSQPLDPTKQNTDSTWIASQMVPFSARMITEKLTCKGTGGNNGTKGQGSLADSDSDSDTYVRVLVNDVVQKLDFCDADANGLCSLSKFVDSQEFARQNGKGDWDLCFGDPTDPKNPKGGKGNGTTVTHTDTDS